MGLWQLLYQFDLFLFPPYLLSEVAPLLPHALMPVKDAVKKAKEDGADSKGISEKDPDVGESEHVYI
jgi:hypothetical protein